MSDISCTKILYSFQFLHCETWRNSTRALVHSRMTWSRGGSIRSRVSFLSAQFYLVRRACIAGEWTIPACSLKALEKVYQDGGGLHNGMCPGCDCSSSSKRFSSTNSQNPFGVRRATDRSPEDTGAKGQSRRSKISSFLGWGRKEKQKSCPRNSLKSIKAMSAQL